MVRAFRFLRRPGSAIVHLAVPQAMVKAVGLVVGCQRPAREKGSRQAVVFAARSLPGFGPFFPAAYLFGFRISPVTADLFAAADLGLAVVVAAVGLGPAVVVVVVVAVVAAGFAVVDS